MYKTPLVHTKEAVGALYSAWAHKRRGTGKAGFGRLCISAGNIMFVRKNAGLAAPIEGFMLYGSSSFEGPQTRDILQSLSQTLIQELGQDMVEFHCSSGIWHVFRNQEGLSPV